MHRSADRWRRADSLFARALELPEADRQAFLEASTGGDPELLGDVVALLDSLDTAERRIGESAALLLTPGLDEEVDPELPEGTRIGAYRIDRQIGKGGMGAVYLASRADRAFDRQVAIKLVPGGAGGARWQSRFAAERRILAGLEHPNIARLYDAGVDQSGQPFLVMEYVAGTRIDRYASQRRLGLRERLTLFLAVCDAVAFAHQRLVVHRDLKPANVLVTEQGEVKLLDFGVARLLAGGDATEPVTRRGHRMLTPEYAAPEEIRGEPATGGADVYSLGAMLYELLTGQRPAWQRLVVQHAPQAALEAAQLPPSGLAGRQLLGDLDVITLTALAPDPVRRYPSVQSLRDDLQRHLDGLPIVARPATLRYLARKFVGRNRALVAAVTAALLLGATYTATVVLQARRLAAERDRAEVERARAQQVSALLVSLFKTGDPFAPGRPDTMRVAQFLERGVDRVNAELARQPLARAQLLTSLGGVFRWRGQHERAAGLLDTAIALLRAEPDPPPLDLAEALTELGNVRRLTGGLAPAESLHREALALRSAALERARASSRAPEVDVRPLAASLANVGAALLEQGRLDEAAPLIDSAVALQRSRAVLDTAAMAEVLNYQATLALRRGQEPVALRLVQESYQLNRARLGADHPRVVLELGNIAVVLGRAGRWAAAESALAEVVRVQASRLPPEHPQLVRSQVNLAAVRGNLGRLAEADSMLRAVIAAERRAGGELQTHLPVTLDQHADLLLKMKRPDEATARYAEALGILRARLPADHPDLASAEIKLAAAHCASAGADARREALAGFERGRRALDAALPAAHPTGLAARARHGDCLSRLGRGAEGESLLVSSFDTAREAHGPGHPLTRAIGADLAAHYDRNGRTAERDRLRAALDSVVPPPEP